MTTWMTIGALLLSVVTGETAVVQQGDTLWKIADRTLGNGQRWQEIAEVNQLREPYLITIGQVLAIPQGPQGATRTTRAEDRPQAVAAQRVTTPSPSVSTPTAADQSSVPTELDPVRAADPSGRTLTYEAFAARERSGTSSDAIVVSLDAFIRAALANNLPLLSGRLSAKSSLADVLRARSVFDPTLTLSATEQRDRKTTYANLPGLTFSTNYRTGVSGTLPSSTQYDVSVTAGRTSVEPNTLPWSSSFDQNITFTIDQPLLKGFGPWIATTPLRIALLASEAAAAQYRRLAERTIAQIENAYWSLSQAEETLQVNEESLIVSKYLLYRNQELFRLNLVAELDVISAQRNLSLREADLIRSRRARRDAEEELVFLAYGRDAVKELREGNATLATEAILPEAPLLPDATEAANRAIASRADLRAASISLEQSRRSLALARNALLPDLKFTGAYSSGGYGQDIRWGAPDTPNEYDKSSWYGGLAFSFPIGLNAAQAERDKAVLDLQGKELACATAENTVRSEVRTAIRAVEAGIARLERTKTAAEFAGRQLEAERKKLELGLSDSYRLLQAEDDARQARLSAVNSRNELLAAITGYRLATGEVGGDYLRENR